MTRMLRAEDFQLPEPVDSPDVVFTYSHPGQSRLRRTLIRSVEAASGRNRIERLYRRWQAGPRDPGQSIFSVAVRALGLVPVVAQGGVDAIPRTGGLLVVANHPFGIADGLAIGHLVALRRPDVKLMVHSLLCQPVEARDVLLPVDFGPGPDARRTSAETRRQAVDWLDQGHALVIFPAGGVATVPSPLARVATDPAWHPFVARLAGRAGVQVVPVFVHGQNSRLFQVLSHFSYPLRIALLFRETLRLKGRALRLSIGPALRLDGVERSAIPARLREETFAMAGAEGPLAADEFIYPKRLRW